MLINKVLLAPYRWILQFRHFLYDKGALEVKSIETPTICVGNITVGGTGKTPHTEMLIRLLSKLPEWKDKQLAVLSRGYKRKSKGYQEVVVGGPARRFGDEPLQIKRKFPDVIVAVDKNRFNGCYMLCDADLIILDDAFQYRALKASVSIVLVDYNRPIFKDHLMPIGHLRDLPERISAADIVIVTKCPSYIKEEEETEFTEKLGFKGPLFYTTMGYDEFIPVFPEGNPRYTHAPRLILFTGIANDKPLYKYLSLNFDIVRHITFGDHHRFTSGDISLIRHAAEEFPNAVIATTEKDAQRLLDCDGIPTWMKERIFCVPVRPYFLSKDDEARFASTLLPYLS